MTQLRIKPLKKQGEKKASGLRLERPRIAGPIEELGPLCGLETRTSPPFPVWGGRSRRDSARDLHPRGPSSGGRSPGIIQAGQGGRVPPACSVCRRQRVIPGPGWGLRDQVPLWAL